MVYRFAAIATASAMPFADVEPPKPLQWGHIKGLVLRHLRYWNDAKDIFRSDGTLNIGYRFDCMNMTENYNAPGKTDFTFQEIVVFCQLIKNIRLSLLVYEGFPLFRCSSRPSLLDFRRTLLAKRSLPSHQITPRPNAHYVSARRAYIPSIVRAKAALRYATWSREVLQIFLFVRLWLFVSHW